MTVGFNEVRFITGESEQTVCAGMTASTGRSAGAVTVYIPEVVPAQLLSSLTDTTEYVPGAKPVAVYGDASEVRSYDAPVVVLRKVKDHGAVPANVILTVPEPAQVDGDVPPVIVAVTNGDMVTSDDPDIVALHVEAGEEKATLVIT